MLTKLSCTDAIRRVLSLFVALSAVLAGELAGAMRVAAAQTSEPVYRGKQIRMVIGNTAGSSYDTYARMLALHLVRHIPGNPTIINQNMPVGCEHAGDKLGFRAGAEGWFGHRRHLQFGPARAALRQSRCSLRSAKIRIRRQHLQAAERLRHLAHASGQDARAGEVAPGDRHGTGTASDSAILPRILNAVLGTKFKVVLGYPQRSGRGSR